VASFKGHHPPGTRTIDVVQFEVALEILAERQLGS